MYITRIQYANRYILLYKLNVDDDMDYDTVISIDDENVCK